jgi:hypothetical protein
MIISAFIFPKGAAASSDLGEDDLVQQKIISKKSRKAVDKCQNK